MRSFSNVYPRYLASSTVLIGELHKLSSDSRYWGGGGIKFSLLYLNILVVDVYLFLSADMDINTQEKLTPRHNYCKGTACSKTWYGCN